MTTRKDFIRQASLSTMNGLTDPRFMPEYAEQKYTSSSSSRFDLIGRLRRAIESILKKSDNRPAHM
ncbi:MAG TPA: hypothetical protein VIN08_00045 [Ohtaekwangia sp.]|uniref:hypothetical protein n=1 Tax=Ohtaekwangia sp. TaxID=2066019 RepID=UPI002F95A567